MSTETIKWRSRDDPPDTDRAVAVWVVDRNGEEFDAGRYCKREGWIISEHYPGDAITHWADVFGPNQKEGD